MLINQRYDNSEQGGREKIVKSKVYENYKNHIKQQMHDSSLSFDSIQTPGWTSLVGTQQSQSTHAIKNVHTNQNQDINNLILTRLNSLPKLNNNEVEYSNIRAVPSSTKNKNIFVYGSQKEGEKKRMQTPKSKLTKPYQNPSNRLMTQSNKKYNASNQLHSSNQPNRFSYSNNGKPNLFFSASKHSQKNMHEDSRRRISSARSESSLKLKDQIKERLSMGNYKPKNITSDFQSNIKTQPNQKNQNPTPKPKSPNKFYSQIHSFNPIREDKYMNRYLQKLNQRKISHNSVKIFKKVNPNDAKQNKPAVQEIPNTSNKQNILPLTLKRFNTITIHDHLYQKGMQMESKKEVERMVDQSYQKANILTFNPCISQKSHFLAQSKFSRQSNAQYSSGHNAQTCFRKGHTNQNSSKQFKSGIFTIQQKMAIKQKEKMAEKQQTQSLIKLFNILSNSTNQINDKNVQVNIEKLPLSLLQILEPLLTQIYQKNTYNQKQFIEMFSSTQQNTIKSIASRRQIVVTQTQRLVKFLQKSQRLQQQKENKQNFIGNFNIDQSSGSKCLKR